MAKEAVFAVVELDGEIITSYNAFIHIDPESWEDEFYAAYI